MMPPLQAFFSDAPGRTAKLADIKRLHRTLVKAVQAHMDTKQLDSAVEQLDRRTEVFQSKHFC
jgi:hypothetical protein